MGYLDAKIASKSLYNPLGFVLTSADESTDELPLLFEFQKSLHLVPALLVEGSAGLPSLLKLDFASSRICLTHEFLVSVVLLLLSREGVVVVSVLSPSPPPLLNNEHLVSSFLISLPRQNELSAGSNRFTCLYKAYHSFAVSASNAIMHSASMKIPILVSSLAENCQSKRTMHIVKMPTSLATDRISTNCTFFFMKGFLSTMKKSWKAAMESMRIVGVLDDHILRDCIEFSFGPASSLDRYE
nr:hypothetical protein Iba_chr03aCG10650 [Ipomoea batatas]